MVKREFKLSILVLIGFLSILWLEKPFREFLSQKNFDLFTAKHISGISIRIVLIIISFFLIKKLTFWLFSGLINWRSFKNPQALLIPLTFILGGFATNWNTYYTSNPSKLCLFLFFVFSVGIVEEVVFRGIIFPLLIKNFKNVKKPILKAAILSSFLFSAVHFVNLFSQPENIIGITSQVFFALSIGVFLCGLMIRTENILIPIVIHALVNFSFGSGELKDTIQQTSNITESEEVNWNSIIPTTIFFAFIFAGGVFMILKSNKQSVLGKFYSNTNPLP